MIYYDIEKDIEIDFCPQKMPKKVYIHVRSILIHQNINPCK